MSGEAIRIENMSFAYPGGETVLEDVSLSVAENDSVLIIGPNGGGKTTLLKTMLGLLTPSRGTVRVVGQPPEKSRAHVGYVPQHTQFDKLYPASVTDVVLMGRVGFRFFGPYSRADKEAARAAMEELGIAGLGRKNFSEISGGQRQRALIARALACEPRLLLLDEPTSNVDPAVEEQMMEIFQALRRKLTIVTVSHDLGFVSDTFRSVVCVNRRVRTHHTSELNGAIIQEVYGRSLRMVHHHPLEGCRECSHS